jgi:aminoglycoside 3-N-acetyltransferase
MQPTISFTKLTEQLIDIGVERGGILLVHTSFSKVAPVQDGPRGLIAALQAVIGPNGTLAMPSMTDDDDHPFDPRRTDCRGMGVVADTFWRIPDVLRSNSPHAFAAIGPKAAEITKDHPVDIPHGLDSPVGRIFKLDGQVLLLGVGHDANTTIHLAENLAGVRYRRAKYMTILRDGQPARYDFSEIDHCCQNFDLMDVWLDAAGRQIRSTIGNAEARLANSREIVAEALNRLRDNETVFLHPAGIDSECDEARMSIET